MFTMQGMQRSELITVATSIGVAVDLTICPCCEQKASDVARRHRNTAYERENDNYLTSCGDCWVRDTELFAEMWAEYYAGLL